MRSLESPNLAKRGKCLLRGRHLLGRNEMVNYHLAGTDDIYYNENPEIWDKSEEENVGFDEFPECFNISGISELFNSPGIEINNDVPSEHDHPICITCVTPTMSTMSSLSDSFSEEENSFLTQVVNNSEDDVIIDLEGHELEQNLENMEDLDANECGHDAINLIEEPHLVLSKLRASNPNRPIIGHINVNFLASKFESLRDLIKDKIDILVITETKIDESFPTGQFSIDGFSTPFRLDRNKFGGGVIIYVKEHLLCVEIPFDDKPKDIECILLDLKIRNKRFLLAGGYNPDKKRISHFLSHLSKCLDKNLSRFDHFLILGDLNSEMSEGPMKDFCDLYDLDNLIKVPTCFKNPEKPSSIDVILTNTKSLFQNSIALETGISDHHKLVITIMKVYSEKQKSQEIKYRSYKNFNLHGFNDDLKASLEQYDKPNMTYDDFKEIFMKKLDKHAPRKTKILRGNNAPFMNKTLSKAMMHRSKLKNNYNKNPTDDNKNRYKKQRNFCVNLLKREKKRYYSNLDVKILDDNKQFWKKVKPLFSGKQKIQEKNIVILEGDEIFSNNLEVAEKLNNFFIEAVENLDIEHFEVDEVHTESSDIIDDILRQYKEHPSILKINENVNLAGKFTFKDIGERNVNDAIYSMDPKKAGVDNDIPAKILRGSGTVIAAYLSKMFNKSKNEGKFPTSLKEGTVVPINKKTTKTVQKKDYRPVNLLANVSKIYERNMFEQTYSYIDQFLSPYLFGYRKGRSTEQCLAIMVEVWKKALDSFNKAGAVLTDLSKAFDCLNHKLLIAKLNAYGFDKNALTFIHDYLKGRKQRTKVNGVYSSWRNVNYGVPQGSILGPLLFNIFINDIFLFMKEAKIANYADDNTAYSVGKSVDDLLSKLESETSTILEWFRINEMKSNDDKCNLIVAKNDNISINVGNEQIDSCNSVELLGVKIDNQLKFTEHVKNMIKKGNQKFHALARISKYLNQDKLKLIMRAFIQSQFNYCPLVWMFHNRTLNNKINRLHERALRLVYKNDELDFDELLKLDNSVTVHHRNLQRLSIEMFKVKNNLAPLPFQDIFKDQNYTKEMRDERSWQVPKVRTVGYGTESIRYRGPATWELIPEDIRKSESLIKFKEEIKSWKATNCACRLCKTFVPKLGFIN